MWAASCRTVVSGISRRSARIAYYGLFALSLIVSWILREVAVFLMEKIPDAVLQVSLGNFLFFTILAILMIGVKSQKDPRDGVHHGGWMMKSFVGASWYIALLVTSLIGYVATFAFCCCYAASIGVNMDGEYTYFFTKRDQTYVNGKKILLGLQETEEDIGNQQAKKLKYSLKMALSWVKRPHLNTVLKTQQVAEWIMHEYVISNKLVYHQKRTNTTRILLQPKNQKSKSEGT